MKKDFEKKISTFKDRLKELMDSTGTRSVDICEATGIEKSVISNYLAARCEPKPQKLLLISEFFNVSEKWLMGYDVPKDRESAPPDELTALLEEIRNDPQKRALFSLAKDATPDDVRQAIAILDALKRTRPDIGSGDH